MPVGFSSPARNLFLLGSTGAQVVSNFFESISKASTTDGVFIPDEIRYIDSNKKYALAGSAQDSNSKGFGWFERQDYNLETGALTTDYSNRIEATQSGVTTTLRAMELDSNNNLIVVGFSGTAPWIAKYSNDGVLDWQSTSNSANVRYLGVTSDSNNNYYACGRTSYTLSDTQAFVEKFDSNGNPGWGKQAFMLGRDVVLAKISANDRGEVVAVGFLEDDNANKGYIVKIDTNTGEVLWDRTLERNISGYGGFVMPSSGDGITPADVKCTACYIDSNDQIYVVGSIDGKGTNDNGVGEFLIKYSPEGNIIWQRERDTRDFINNPQVAPDTVPFDVKSDGETEQTVVLSVDTGPGAVPSAQIELSKYSKSGDLVFRRRISKGTDQLGAASLDADPSFYYFIFRDQAVDGLAGEPDRYTFGKVSTSGNGLGNFQYDDGTATIVDYNVANDTENKIGRMSDGSVTNSVSDLMTYPFTANQVVFDDLATHVSNKKRQMDSADSFEYSGSPAIRIADFQQELNLLGDTGITEPVNNTPTIGTIVYGTDNADNSFDSTNDGSLVLDTTGYTFNTWSGSQLMSGLGGFGANSAQVWRTTNYDSVLWTISTDTSDRYIYTSDDGINWIQSTDLYDTDAAPVNVTSKWLATSAGANVSTITVSGVPGGTNYTNRWDATVNYNHGGTYAFDGSESTRVEPKDNQRVTWTAGTAIPVGSTLEFNIVRAGTIAASDFQVNGTNYGGSVPNSQGWITIPESSLSSFSLYHNSGTSSVEVFAVRIDGSILTDGDDVPTGASTPGAWVDQSGKGNDGAVIDATHNAAGYWEFDGVDDEIDLGTTSLIAPSSSFSIEAWCWVDALTVECSIYEISASDNSGTILLSAGSNFDGNVGGRFLVRNTSGQDQGVRDVIDNNLGEWHHYVGVHINDGNYSSTCLYVDGVGTMCQDKIDAPHTFDFTNVGVQHLGLSSGTRYLDGRIGEIRIYPRALTAAAVFQNYNATKSKYINEAPDTAPKIGPGIVYGSDLLLNYDFGNRATYDNAENLVAKSEDFSGSEWVSGGTQGKCDVIDTDILSPFGTRNVQLLDDTSSAIDGEATDENINITPSNTQDYCFSVYAKKGTAAKFELYLFYTQTSVVGYRLTYVWDTDFIAAAGAEGANGVAPNYGYEDAGNGWYRFWLSASDQSLNTQVQARIYPASRDTGQTGSTYFWGAQVEKQSTPGRYIRTYGSSITAPTTVKNLSGSSITGTIDSAVYNTGGWFEFTGPTSSNTRIVFDSSSVDLSGSFTIDMWFRQDTQGAYHMLLGAQGYGAAGNGIGHYLFSNTIRTWVQEGEGTAVNIWDSAGTTTLTQNVWHNLVLLRESGTAWRWYLDGSLVNSNTTDVLTADFTTPNTYIGDHYNTNIYHFDGDIGALRMYSRALTATEVSQNFNATRGKYGV